MPDVDHVFLLPGIMGSVLEKGGEDVWALSLEALLRAAGDRNLEALALRGDPVDQEELGDGIRASRLLPTVQILPGFWKVDGYSTIAAELGRRMGVAEARVHAFAYDWRRDNRVAARRLAREVERIRAGEPGARFTFVGHSMGGLVARYYVEVLGGWRHTRALFTLGTPHRGSLNAVGTLANGISWKLGPLHLFDLTETLRTFTSLYQLLPIYPCVQAGDGLRRVTEVDLPGVDAAKVAAGVAFHREIEAAVSRNLKEPDYRDRFPFVFPVVGTHQPTNQMAVLEGQGVRLLRSYPGFDLDGDGTVPRVSATPLEMGDLRREVFTPCMHGMLQNAAVTLDQLEGVTASEALPYGQFRDARPAARRAPADSSVRLGLSVDDLFCGGEPVWFRVQPSRDPRGLTAEIRDGAGKLAAGARLRRAADGWYEPPAGSIRLAPGSYRLRISGQQALPIEDLFLVLDLPRPRRKAALPRAAASWAASPEKPAAEPSATPRPAPMAPAASAAPAAPAPRPGSPSPRRTPGRGRCRAPGRSPPRASPTTSSTSARALPRQRPPAPRAGRAPSPRNRRVPSLRRRRRPVRRARRSRLPGGRRRRR